MKKSFSLLLLSCVFALPAYAQTPAQVSGQAVTQTTSQTMGQTTQSTKTTTTKTTTEPVQVNVTINNTASAQGNTQTTTIDNTQNQSTAPAAAASTQSTGTTTSSSLFGDYTSSPYHSNPQIEMLRNSVWTSLVPRKKLYNDPAGKNAGTYYYGQSTTTKSQTTAQSSKSKSSTSKSSKTKSSTAQAGKTKSTTAANQAKGTNAQSNTLANGTQNLNLDELKEKLATGQMIILEQKDGEICIPLEQFAQLTGQKAEQIPGQIVVQGMEQTAPANGANGISVNGANSVFYSPVPDNSANGANGSAASGYQTTAPANTSSPAPFSPAASASPSSSVSPASSVNPANSASSAVSPANPPRTVTPLGGGTEDDIFAIPSNPFDPAAPATASQASSATRSANPASPANPAITGNTNNPLGQNPMARDPLAPQAQRDNQRDISVTQNMTGTQTVTTSANGQTSAASQTVRQTNP